MGDFILKYKEEKDPQHDFIKVEINIGREKIRNVNKWENYLLHLWQRQTFLNKKKILNIKKENINNQQ